MKTYTLRVIGGTNEYLLDEMIENDFYLPEDCYDAYQAEPPIKTTVYDDEILMMIFADGFSTRDGITDISGRGVGLNAVKAELVHLGGSVQIASVLGQGTRFTFTLPYKPAPVGKGPDTAQQQVAEILAPLPRLMATFCETYLRLPVVVDKTLREFTADTLLDFTAILSLDIGLKVTLGLSIERPLLLAMTRAFEPDFSEDDIVTLADSVGAEIANTLFGNVTVYFTHLAQRAAIGTPEIVGRDDRAAWIGHRAFRGFCGRGDTGSFIIFCALPKETSP